MQDKKNETEIIAANIMKFQKFFGDADGDFILGVIDGLTGYGKDTFNKDPHYNAYLNGRSSVSARIREILELKTKESIEVYAMLRAREQKQQKEEIEQYLKGHTQ